jgi:hypothetical protein
MANFKKIIWTLYRYDGANHWIISTEQDSSGKTKRKNCRHCYEKLKKELKTVTQCEKCKIPLHTSCFKEGFINYHSKGAVVRDLEGQILEVCMYSRKSKSDIKKTTGDVKNYVCIIFIFSFFRNTAKNLNPFEF